MSTSSTGAEGDSVLGGEAITSDAPQSEHASVEIRGDYNRLGNQGDVPSTRVRKETLDLIWSYCKAALRKSIEEHIIEAYIVPLSIDGIELDGGAVIISAPSSFICVQVEKHYRESLRTVISEALLRLDPVLRSAGVNLSPDQPVQLKFRVDSSRQIGSGRSKGAVVAERIQQNVGRDATERLQESSISGGAVSVADSPLVVKKLPALPEVRSSTGTSRPNARGINPKYTFANYVVGASNEFCHAAAMRVAEQPGKSYNPFFIYGGVGLGKTHLLHAIANAALARNSSMRVLYMSSETFTNELIHSLRTEKMREFKSRLRSVELLLIDDIQFLCGKERTQEEFFHTFNALYDAKHQIVVTSDKLPQEIPGIEERLQTRFSWGLTADLQAPDFETRVAILKRKAAVEGVEIPEDVAHLIAERISSNVRELEGALTRLHALSSLQGSKISAEFAQSALRSLIAPKSVNLSVDDIKRSVAEFFNIRVSEIISKKRTRNLSFPRHIAMYLCRKHTTLSYPEIGEHFGGRDHSSVIHASNVVATKVAHDPDTRQLVGELERRLIGHSSMSNS